MPLNASTMSTDELPDYRRWRSGIVAAVVLVIAAVAGLQAINHWLRYRAVIEATERRMGNLALVLGEHLQSTVSAADAALKQIALQSDRLGGPGGPKAEWDAVLAAALSGLNGIGSLSITDATGIIRHSTLPAILGQSRRDLFVFQRLQSDPDANLVADRPFRGLTQTLLPIGRRLSDRSGGFAGSVVATMIPQQLDETYRTVNIGRDGVVALIHPSGVPLLSVASDGRAPGAEQISELARRHAEGVSNLHMPLNADAPISIIALHTIAEPPITVAVAFGKSQALSGWYDDVLIGLVLTIGFAVALAAAAWLAWQRLIAQQVLVQRSAQAEKIAALGQLTGGVAHDFNNMLAVIVGQAEVMKASLPASDDTRQATCDAILRAAENGAELTQHLLAFARRQPLQPQVFDINKQVAALSPLLHRTLGEHISIRTICGPEPLLIEADPGQIDSAILNLCINARDAMPQGGNLTIETQEAALDEAYATQHSEVLPGSYVVLSVSDDGCGMSEEVAARAFEPFFTTKGQGRGSGLGLSMVYGFVKQSGGHIKIYSEPGHGTTIKLYLPHGQKPAETADMAAGNDRPSVVGLKVLVVEDDQDVRDTALTLLRSLHCEVQAATDARTALDLLDREQFDLLFTDVVLPGGMNGAILARKARERQPQLAVVYTSGYTENAIIHQGRLDPGVDLLSKPYRRDDLLAKLHQALLRQRLPDAATR